MANIVTKAKAIKSYDTIEKYVNWYKDIKYIRPIYQRKSDLKAAAEILVHFIYLVTEYDNDFLPDLDPIHIRWATDELVKVLEIIDGQHRSDCFVAIFAGHIEVPAVTSNSLEQKICDKWKGRTFHTLPAYIQKAIKNLMIPVTEHQCSEENARAFFHALNAAKPLSTPDKTRNNYCRNNLYKAVEAVVEAESKAAIKSTALTPNGLRNMIYRCMVCTSVSKFASARQLNAAILDDNATISAAKANKMVAEIMKKLSHSYSILTPVTNGVHIAMGTYMYLESIPSAKDRKTIISKIKANKEDFNMEIGDAILKSKFSFVDTPSAKNRSDAAKDIVTKAVKVVI